MGLPHRTIGIACSPTGAASGGTIPQVTPQKNSETSRFFLLNKGRAPQHGASSDSHPRSLMEYSQRLAVVSHAGSGDARLRLWDIPALAAVADRPALGAALRCAAAA